MKFISMTLFAMKLLAGVHSLKDEHSYQSLQEGGQDLESEEYYFVLIWDPAAGPYLGCLTVNHSNAKEKQKLSLKECKDDNNDDQFWWYDGDTKLFHTKLNDEMCMQAGLGGTPGYETKLCLFPCDGAEYEEYEDLRKFNYTHSGGTIKLKNTNLCVIFRGIHSNFGEPIILKPCGDSEGQKSWTKD
jgi:hypothetical protein